MARSSWIAMTLPLVFLAACGGGEKTADTLAEDSALARDIAMAGRDSLADPVMTDLSTGAPEDEPSVSAAPTVDAPARAPTGRPATSTAPAGPSQRIPSSPATKSQPSASRPTGSSPTVSTTPGTPGSNRGNAAPRSTASAPPVPPPRPGAPEPVPVGSAGSAPAPRPGGGRVLAGETSGSARRGTVPAGSSLALNAGSKVCTNTNRVGQTFNATVANSVAGSNGSAIPAGATAVVEITELKRASDDGEPVRMGFHVASISFGGSTYPVDATATSASIARVTRRSSRQAEKIVGGAAIGAVAGQVIGNNTKSTVTGAVVGAAIGAAAGAAPAPTSFDGCIPSGGRINTVLNSSVRI